MNYFTWYSIPILIQLYIIRLQNKPWDQFFKKCLTVIHYQTEPQILLRNTDCLKQVEEYVRGCTWQLKSKQESCLHWTSNYYPITVINGTLTCLIWTTVYTDQNNRFKYCSPSAKFHCFNFSVTHLLYSHSSCYKKCLHKRVVSLGTGTIYKCNSILLSHDSASEIWTDKRGDLCSEWPYKKGTNVYSHKF